MMGGDEIERWVSSFLWYWEPSAVQGIEAAREIVRVVREYDSGLRDLPDPEALIKSIEEN